MKSRNYELLATAHITGGDLPEQQNFKVLTSVGVDQNCIVRYSQLMKRDAVTPAEYRVFQQAYDFFNRELFENSLPQVFVTLQRHHKTAGYFSPERFTGRVDATVVDELALNPDSFSGQTDSEILSILAHEMAHVWQEAHGKPGRGRYHNLEWAAKMKEIGLHPSDTGAPGGKETGDRVSHYIIAGGLYAKAYSKLKAKGLHLHWQSQSRQNNNTSKTKFTCPECGQNAWAKPGASLICGECTLRMTPNLA